MRTRLFGTDGVRGIAGEEPLSPEMTVALGRAIAERFRAAETRPVVVVGRDTRHSGDMLEAALCAGLCAAGADVRLVGVVPTPAVAFVTSRLEAVAGVMISASHNSYPDNGIKVFSSTGFKLPDAVESEIEATILGSSRSRALLTGEAIGRVSAVADAADLYLAHLRSSIDCGLRLDGMKIVIDAGHGAASGLATRIFEALGASTTSIGSAPDGKNINAGVGALHPEVLANTVVALGADFGVALDGDADRAILVDERGAVCDGDGCLALCAEALLEEGRLASNTVVATVMSNLGLERYLQRLGIRMLRTQVGDRYVVEAMQGGNFVLGGEQSGHIVFLEHGTTGDGLLTALQVASIMRRRGRGLAELLSGLEHFPQILLNTRIMRKQPIETLPGVTSAIRYAEESLGEQGRVLVRFSGTEPLARVMVEGTDAGQIRDLAQNILNEIVRELG